MKLKQSLLRTAVFTTPLLLIFSGLSVNASESQPPTPKLMECVEITGYAKLGEDLSCKIASSHHRTEQYPEATFFYDEMPEACSDPAMVCCVRGMMWGTIGEYGFVAGAACGFTVNDFAASDLGAEAAAELAEIGYQQFTARTMMRVFLNTTEMPVHANPDKEVKADFGLFLGDSGVSRDDMFVSQRMVLTGARKLPRGTKMKLDMVGRQDEISPVREISGTMCGPNLVKVLDNIAQTGPGGNDDEDDDD